MFSQDSKLIDMVKKCPYGDFLAYKYRDETMDWKLDVFSKTVSKSLNEFVNLCNENKVKQYFYSDGEQNIIHLSHKNNSRFALIFAGGGFGSVANFYEGLEPALAYFHQGFDAFIVTYSLKSSKAINDALDALKYIIEHKEQFKISLDKYMIMGFSAGGYLASYVSAKYQEHDLIKPGLLVLGYPVISMLEHRHEGSFLNLLGNINDPQKCEKYSIQNLVTDNFPITYIWQCDKDNVVDIENSKMLVKSLKNKNITYMFKTYDSVVHGYSLGRGTIVDGWFEEMIDFYKRIVR